MTTLNQLPQIATHQHKTDRHGKIRSHLGVHRKMLGSQSGLERYTYSMRKDVRSIPSYPGRLSFPKQETTAIIWMSTLIKYLERVSRQPRDPKFNRCLPYASRVSSHALCSVKMMQRTLTSYWNSSSRPLTWDLSWTRPNWPMKW